MALRAFLALSFLFACAGAAWISDPALRELAKKRVQFTESLPVGNTTVPRHRVNLDLDPIDRYICNCIYLQV